MVQCRRNNDVYPFPRGYSGQSMPATNPQRPPRVFSGIQPSGHLTIGNYLGALKNWVKVQDKYECFFCVVDLHAITLPQDPRALCEGTRVAAASYLSPRIDLIKSTV